MITLRSFAALKRFESRETPRQYVERKLREATELLEKLPKGKLREGLEIDLSYAEREFSTGQIKSAGTHARNIVNSARDELTRLKRTRGR